MMKYVKYYIVCLFLLSAQFISAQGLSVSDTLTIPANFKPEFKRQLNHDKIDAEQKRILASDGKADSFFNISDNEEINYLATQALTKKVDVLQYLIETDTLLDHRLKVKYLYGLESVLKYFSLASQLTTDKKVNPAGLPIIIRSYEECVNQDKRHQSIEPIIEKLPYDVGIAVLGADIFENNKGYTDARNNLVLKFCTLHPEKMLATLMDNPGMPFADSLVRAIDKMKFAKQLYDYSQANNSLGRIIRSINDDKFIRTIVQMAKSRSGQQYFPFLDNIVSGKLTIADIDEVKNDSLLYYRLLVKTEMDYAGRLLNKDTAFEYKSLSKRLVDKAKASFVNIINGLHTEAASVRFKCIQPLTAEELYYLAVSSDGSIYTSSFVKGVFPLMMKKINYRGDSLLMLLHFDKYRKFIKMSAGFNTLSTFLSSFPQPQNPGEESYAEKLMKAFVGKLEQGDGLEDGVDVADSYASIEESIKPLAVQMLKNVEDNYERNKKAGNKRGMAIYNILRNLFLSADTANHVDLTKVLGIPPIYEMPYKSLVNKNGQVVMQVFFYGDKDGQGIFRGFVRMFQNRNWQIDESNKQWVKITSANGKPVIIFANRALPEELGEDEQAQKALHKYMEQNQLFPTVTIHRGHSYYADATISQMFPSSKIVFLGSCGGYHLIHDVLAKADDAHIIASKQIGATEVNRPFFQLLADKVRTGQNIDWIPFWEELDRMVAAREFEDYIPPYKNLGALFIKAYKIAMGEEAEPKSF